MPENIVVPELGESIVEARVVRWLKQKGDRVNVGEAVVELETEKVNLEVGATRAGLLGPINHRDGEDVKVGDVLATIEPEDSATPPAGGMTPAGPPPGRVAQTPAEAPAPRTSQEPPRLQASQQKAARTSETGQATEAKTRSRSFAEPTGTLTETASDSPSVRRRAREQEDSGGASQELPVKPAQRSTPTPDTASPHAPGAADQRREERVRMSKRRATIARRLVEAQHAAAMLTTFNEIDMSAFMALRERHKERFRQRFGVGLGITSIFVKAVCLVLHEFPRLNAEVQGDEMVLKHYYDIGVAVGAPDGLVVPVLRDADHTSFADAERRIKEFARKAEDRSLTLEDLRGGTFTITNGGIFGSLLSTPILNPPQVGILGLHKIEDRAIVVSGHVEVRPMMYVALSYDHRIVDGLEAVQFLVRLKSLVEDPDALLLEA